MVNPYTHLSVECELQQPRLLKKQFASFTTLAVFLMCGLFFISEASASNNDFERQQLVLVLKQIKNAQIITQETDALISPADTDRFWFDYQQLITDLQRIEDGISNYLAPSRAQPRAIYGNENSELSRSFSRDKRERGRE